MKIIKHFTIFIFFASYFYCQIPVLISGYSDISDRTRAIKPISEKYNATNLSQTREIQVKKYQLHQNYPNPFNPTTTIKYSMTEQNFILIKVYDLLGKEITTLVNQVMPVGTHEVIFDASDLPGGMYFVKMTVGVYTEARKIILLK